VGSRSQSVGIGVELRGASQGNPQKGDLARRKSSNPLTRAMMVQRWIATGRADDVNSVWGSAEVLLHSGARAKRCAGDTPNCHRGGVLFGLVQYRKILGFRSWNAPRSSASSQGIWHDGRRLESFLHSPSNEEDCPLVEGGRWSDSDSQVRTTRRASRGAPSVSWRSEIKMEPTRWCLGVTRGRQRTVRSW
jgi:hypothetical protein